MDLAQDVHLNGSVLVNNLDTIPSSCSSNSTCSERSNQETVPDCSKGLNVNKIHKCSQCDSVFFRYSHLQDHLNRHTGDRKYLCKERKCTKTYFAWKQLRKHLIASHKLDNVKKSLYVKETESKRFKCSYEGCIAAFNRSWKLNSHMCKHTGEKLHPCTENGCNKAYSTVGHLRRHFAKSHMPNNGEMVKNYLCPEVGCEKVYQTVSSLRKHHLIHHNKDRPIGPPFRCTYCERNFNSLEFLGHHKCASYLCEVCKSKFRKRGVWRKHMKRIHHLYGCSVRVCSKVFPRFSLMKEHKETDHKNYLLCSTCNKNFGSKRSLKDHQKTHLLPPEKRFNFPCPYDECNRFYTRKFNLDQHIRSSHEDIKFDCTVPGCEKRLVTKQKLQEHMKLHDPHREPVQRKQMAKRQRKDAGQPKRSMAVKLSGVSVSYGEEQMVLRSGNNLYTPVPGDISWEASETSDGNVISEAEEGSELSSEECSEESDASDESDELPSRYSEMVGRMTGDRFDCKTQLHNDNLDEVQSVPLNLVKNHKPMEQDGVK